MDWVEALKDVNYLAVLGAVASSFVVGMLWYAPQVFGKVWAKEAGLKQKDLESKEGMPRAMSMTAVSSFVTAAGLGALLIGTLTSGAADGAAFGAVIGFAFSGASMVTHDAFTKKSATYTVINAAHDVVKFAIMGAILGGWA